MFNAFTCLLGGRKLTIILGIIFNAIVGTTCNVSGRIVGTVGRFSVGVVVTFGPRLIRSCTSKRRAGAEALVCTVAGVSCVVLFTVSLPMVVRTSCVLAL